MNKDYPDIYLLAEAERDNLADATETFDANYAWELHHLLNSLAQGRKTVADLKEYVTRDAARFPKEAFRLTFTSNHDENSWSGTEFRARRRRGERLRRPVLHPAGQPAADLHRSGDRPLPPAGVLREGPDHGLERQ